LQLGFARPITRSHPDKKSGGGFGLREIPKILGSPIIFLQRLRLATSNLASCWGLPRPIIKSHAEECGRGSGLGELPKIWEFPFNVYTMAEASNLVHNLGLPRPTIKPHPEEKWAWPWAGEAPFNISATGVLSS